MPTLARNVAEIRRPPKVEQREIEILAPEQIADVLAKLEGHTLFPIVSLALATGMRRGELLGLQWGDIDLDRGVLRVERSVSLGAGGRSGCDEVDCGSAVQATQDETRTAQYHPAP